MGMTDKQFNGFVRLVLDGLKEAKEFKQANNEEKLNEKLDKIIDILQKTLED